MSTGDDHTLHSLNRKTCGGVRFFRTLSRVAVSSLIAIVSVVAGSSSSGVDSTVDAAAPWSVRIADTFLLRHPHAATYDTGMPDQKWKYEQGLMLTALDRMSVHSGDKKYFDFVRDNLDHYVEDNGSIRTYKLTDFNLDLVCPGRALLAVYEATDQPRFRAAADTLRKQLREQPRTHEGGFWHKKIYPYQMWLDGLYMAEPFYALYAKMFHEPEAFDDIANQFIWIAEHTRDPKTGLYYHGWDESRKERWANPQTGCSPSLWGRAMGWYGMALVDVLDYFPTDHPKRNELISILRDFCHALLDYRDPATLVWHQVVDQGGRKGNYLESSASCMFVYTFARGANKGYLDRSYLDAAEESFSAIIKQFVTVSHDGLIDLHNTCKGAGLGNVPYRDGSFEYYVSEQQRTNDMKGIGPFLLAAIELEQGGTLMEKRR